MRESPTIGILYCGDLGAALAGLLQRAGNRVVTTCQGRSSVTGQRSVAAGVEILPTLDDVVRQSDLVFSIVLPAAAIDVARQYVERDYLRPANSLFVDANSISVETIAEIEHLGQVENPTYVVDAAIHGGAQRLAELGVMYVSGPLADRVEAVCRDVLRVRRLGDQVGSATRMKLLIAGLSKSLNALFLEVGALAHQAEMIDPFLESCRHFYPGLMTAIDRMLPTYPQHAARRVGELQSIEQLAQACGAPSGMIHAAGELMQQVARVDWDCQTLASGPAAIPQIIGLVARACQPDTRCHTSPEVTP